VKRPIRISLVCIVLIPCFLVGGWVAAFPDEYDIHNIHYVLWKRGIVSIDPDRALNVTAHDDAYPLLLGKSPGDLRAKFGYLRSLDQASPYMRYCYENSSWRGKPVMFLRDTDWMVVLEKDRVTDFAAKGC